MSDQSRVGPPYLEFLAASQILDLALPSRRRRLICRKKPGASHAAAVVAVALTARGIAELVQHVRDILDTRAGEMDHETIFAVEKLEEHVIVLRRVVSDLSCLARHLTAECYRPIPGAALVYNEVVRARDFLEEQALGPIEEFLQDWPSPEHRRERIKDLIKKRAFCALVIVLGNPAMLLRTAERARDLVERMKDDWERDVAKTHADPHCARSSGRITPKNGSSSADLPI
jgi:hypothetical protein